MAEKSRDELGCLAQLAEHSERYDDMVDAMKKIVLLNNGLSKEERNLLSVAYKNVVGARRSAWRIVSASEQKADDMKKKEAETYRKEIEGELSTVCSEVFEILDKYLIPAAKKDMDDVKDSNNIETLVFFNKMKGDYYRYLVEVSIEDNRKGHQDNAHEAYKEAEQLSLALNSTNPIRLGLALNYSVFYYEIMNLPDKACQVSRDAYDLAIDELDQVKEDTYKDSTLILQLIRDNLTLWTSEQEADGDPEA